MIDVLRAFRAAISIIKLKNLIYLNAVTWQDISEMQ